MRDIDLNDDTFNTFNKVDDEDKLIEERRKRRRAILEKYKNNIDSPASLSGSTKVSNDTDDNDANSKYADTPRADTPRPETPRPDTPRADTPLQVSLAKENIEYNDTPEIQMSAADYDPTADKKEDEEKMKTKILKK